MKFGSMRRLIISVVGMSIALGCSAGDNHETGRESSSTGSSVSTDGPCVSSSSSTGGSLTIPECVGSHTIMFQGTVNGAPYNKTFYNYFSTGDFSTGVESDDPPWGQVWDFTDTDMDTVGVLAMDWTEYLTPNKFVPATGKLTLPDDSPTRDLKPGSSLVAVCGKPVAFIIIVDGVELAGCATD